MNKSFSLLATLALAAVLLPIALAQAGQTTSPNSDQTSQPSATQPSTDQTTQPGATQPSATQPSATQPSTDQNAQPSTEQVQPATPAPGQTPEANSAPAATQNTFSGTVVKAGGKYVLKNDTMTYQLDDQVKARQFEGKQVSVMGNLDKSTSVIHVSDIMTPDQK